jgi:predicted ATPase
MLNSNIRVDLHIHSRISEYKEADGIVEDSVFENIDVLLTKLNENKISLFGFSDHNRFDKNLFKEVKEYIELEDTKTKYPHVKNLLPVIEFDVIFEEDKKKCHVLAVFDYKSDDNLDDIERVIESNKLTNSEQAYERDEFEKIIRDIGQDVILIAAQRKSLDNPRGGENSLSDSVDDIYEFLKVGYISTLEVQKSAVQGMILKNLVDFPRQINFVSGSDCHQWEYYPKHSKNENFKDKNYYFTVKAQPTFSGLVMALTSPESRFDRAETINYPYIQSISLNNQEIRLSHGINTIIGENGSGKSTIVYGLLEETNTKDGKYAKKILADNKFSVYPSGLSSNIFGVRQSEIINNSKNGFIFSEKENYFQRINHQNFENNIMEYSNKLFNNISNNIDIETSLKQISNLNFTIDLDFEDRQQYYIQIIADRNLSDSNIHQKRLIEINDILIKIIKESQNDYYDNESGAIWLKIVSEVSNLRNKIIKKYKERKGEIYVKNIISSGINDYTTDINSLIGVDDKKTSSYNKAKNDFKSLILNHVINLKTKSWEDINFPNKINGQSTKPHRGYNFIKIARYSDEDLSELFYEKVFKKEYRSIEKLKEIKDEKKFAESILNANEKNYEETYKSKISTLIKELKEEDTYIQKAGENIYVGSTLGEQSLVFYDYMVHEEKEESIIIIDQPEDNISNTKILSDLIKKFSLFRDQKQIILVTHNPMLVVNLDTDNVIYLQNINGKLMHKSGCLESEGIISLVAKTMDGGVEALERR